jgi:hypothetical protein
MIASEESRMGPIIAALLLRMQPRTDSPLTRIYKEQTLWQSP